MDRHRKRAMALIASDRTRSALNLRAESDPMRDRYGRHLFGQSCLMARRMVEAGTRFVTVHYDCARRHMAGTPIATATMCATIFYRPSIKPAPRY